MQDLVPESYSVCRSISFYSFLNSHMNNILINGQILPELFTLPNLMHLQLDYNTFGRTTIPDSYSNMSKLLKQDLSSNHLDGIIPPNKLSPNITTIDFDSNQLSNISGSFDLPLSVTLRFPASRKGSISKGALIGIILGGIAAAVTLLAIVSLVIVKANLRGSHVL
ncbi:hypothetical protein Ddye_019846 [Dipteronia dyeriana]|uniref:Uncharacterized protein n=1 Tax=Dipteronia dyeriana TaxID=168575 RepID=A0AAD9TYQ4_9ROSI|nr:hypothetical protein Ddye_019846 [Dipteronia dyeriana]